MKKTLACVLALMLLCTAAMAMAEEEVTEPMPIEITYEGDYIQIGEYNLAMMIPEGWVQVEDEEDMYLAFASADGEWMLLINEEEVTEENTLEGLQAQVEANEAITEAMPLMVNEFLYVLYDIPEEHITGAYLVNEGKPTTLHFLFMPTDDAEYAALALQMLASITELKVQ